MLELIQANQLNIMLVLSSACATFALFVLIARALPKRKRISLLLLELSSMFLLYFDRLAYMYSGDMSPKGHVMVRVTNFLVFSLTLVVILALNLYLIDLLLNEGGLEKVPKRLIAVRILGYIGILLVVISAFTGLYYYFDELNKYHRGPGFLLCYLFPLITPLIMLTVVIQYRKKLNKGVCFSIVLFIVLPIIASIIQIFAYGLSLTNMTIVGVAMITYIFALFDINNKLENANKREIEFLKEERLNMQNLFEQTASAFVSAIDAKDEFSEGHSQRVANYAKKIAKACGKNEKACDEIYYSALLHDVGNIGMSKPVKDVEGELTEEEKKALDHKTLIGDKLLSNISDYPYLKDGANYVYERYDGSGYPDGLKGEAIPEAARIIAVADHYDNLTSTKSYRAPFPQAVVREEFVREAGKMFDPRFSTVMVSLIDSDPDYDMSDDQTVHEFKDEIVCDEYRDDIQKGILIENIYTDISFKFEEKKNKDDEFSNPSMIIYDSFDGRVHDNKKTIKAFHYLEYGEIWFDGNVVCTAARNITVKEIPCETNEDNAKKAYSLRAGRYEDHVKIIVSDGLKSYEVTMALQDSSKYAYIGLTGEHCIMSDFVIEKTDKAVEESDIERIANKISYLNRLEGDLPNIQIDKTRSKYTEGIPLRKDLNLIFHTMSLPSASLVWNCPYILIYSSDDNSINGDNYREYALIKLNGETDRKKDYSDNTIEIEKTERFKDWDKWLEKNRKGFECEVEIERKGNSIVTCTEAAGVQLTNVTVLKEVPKQICVALTGDQCVLTDIRVR
ncbi:MAG: HD domain-containing protein [Lachnospiraceae bacterium]|nr:HD domain-containing protein [Lachnospiraceae bacterium]